MLLLWKTLEPVMAETGLACCPHATLRDCPPLDVLCVPGGPGVTALMEDAEVLAFLRGRRRMRAISARSAPARWCSAPPACCAAGGRRRTGASHDLLRRVRRDADRLGRVVRDGNLFTGGGVTAGIDFALTMVAETRRSGSGAGDPVADRIRAGATIRCRNAGDGACRMFVSAARARGAAMRTEREAIVARISRDA